MSHVPPLWAFVLLGLGAYRLTRLAGWDDFPLAVRLRNWATGYVDPHEQFLEDFKEAMRAPLVDPGRPTEREEFVVPEHASTTVPTNIIELERQGFRIEIPPPEPQYRRPRRPTLAHFIGCPFCVGFWISVAVWGAWLAAPRPTLIAMTPFALSALVGLVAKNLDP